MQVYLQLIIVPVLLGSISVSSRAGHPETDKRASNDTLLRIQLSKKMISWLQGHSDDAAECDRLIDRFLAMPREQRSLPGYLAVAQAANLRGRPDQAILTLESLIAQYPDQDAPVLHVPMKVLAAFWIGTYAKQAGNVSRSVQAYEEVLKIVSAPDPERKTAFGAIAKLYLAELDARHFKNPSKAIVRLDSIEWNGTDATQEQRPDGLLRRMVAYERTAISGQSQAVPQWPDRRSMEHAPVSAAGLLWLAGVTASPLSDTGGPDSDILGYTMLMRTMEGGGSQIDASLARLLYAYDQDHKGAIDQASEHYSALLKGDSFFSPVAGMALHRIQMRQGKENEAKELIKTLRMRYPGAGRAWDEIERGKVDNGSKKGQPPKQ
jgi:tetratricopeptide (TPR) repeat protein